LLISLAAQGRLADPGKNEEASGTEEEDSPGAIAYTLDRMIKTLLLSLQEQRGHRVKPNPANRPRSQTMPECALINTTQHQKIKPTSNPG